MYVGGEKNAKGSTGKRGRSHIYIPDPHNVYGGYVAVDPDEYLRSMQKGKQPKTVGGDDATTEDEGHGLPAPPKYHLALGPMVNPQQHPDLMLSDDAMVNAVMYAKFDWQTYTWPTGINYYCVIDIEKSGPRPGKKGTHFMPSLGATLIRKADGKNLHELLVAMHAPKGGSFSKICQEQFWDQPANAANLAEWSKVAVPYVEGLAAFRDWLYKMQRQYGPKGFVICTDCPEADITFLSQEFNDRLDENPLYHPEGDELRFESICHVNEYGRGVGHFDWMDPEGPSWRQVLRNMGVRLPPDSMHDHNPVHDATYIGLTLRAIRLWVLMQRSKRAVYGPMGWQGNVGMSGRMGGHHILPTPLKAPPAMPGLVDDFIGGHPICYTPTDPTCIRLTPSATADGSGKE
jgi:hypothetical protein